jgi:hypothetical protein
VSNLDNVLNRIYCLSQEASSTVINLRAYPHIVKNTGSYQLYSLLKELHLSTLEAYKNMRFDSQENNLDSNLVEILSKEPDLERTYGTLINNISLPPDHFLVRKLNMQVNKILLTLKKLDQFT